MKSRRGVTLIMVAAVLAILAALGTGFYTMIAMQSKSALHYSDMVRAEMMARAGINFSIAKLRAQSFQRTEDTSSAWYMVDYMRGASKRVSFPDSPLLHDGLDNDNDGVIDNPEEALTSTGQTQSYSASLSSSVGTNSDYFALGVTDAASKININAGDNLAVMLDNLCRAIGPPLVAADTDAIQPRRWFIEGDSVDPQYGTNNANDTVTNNDIYYTLTDAGGAITTNGTGRPMRAADGSAVYGDGYAIAGYRGRNGAFRNLEDIKAALTYVERNGNSTPDDPLEQLEIEVKFAAIRDHITLNSWVDTNTVGVGKFEWIHVDTGGGKTIAIDRDKSWIVDDLVKDPLNLRGSLRGCYLSIMNGHGAGQLRRIRTNGIDWLEVEGGFAVTPGPTSSYMIVSNEESMLMDIDGAQSAYAYPDNPPPAGSTLLPMTNPDGTLVHNPKMDYSVHPLCIHRAPVNVNTATDKVLVALLLGINVQHGHPLALGTDADVDLLRQKWKIFDDPNNPVKTHHVEPYVLTPAGLKRVPQASGKLILNRAWGIGPNLVPPPPAGHDVAYLNNFDTLGSPNFLVAGAGVMSEAHELAYRIIMARQIDLRQPTLTNIDPLTGAPTATSTGLLRGPFRTWDDLYFRVIKPWDDARFKNGYVDKDGNGKINDGDEFHAARLSTMIMANFNSNTDILKFNPNIEWIDRWGRNFTEQEPVMVFTNETAPGDGVFRVDVPAAATITATSVPIYTAVFDPNSNGWTGGNVPPPSSGQKDSTGNFIEGAYIIRSFRYKSDEMIDKTDLNRSTTEFSFDSNGIFEINSTGQVAKGGIVLAERKFTALVKVYDVWRETTQAQFAQGTISKAFGDRRSKGDPQTVAKNLRCTGQLARDASGIVEAKGLVTLPEPLQPLQARIVDANGNPNPRNYEAVSGIVTGSKDPLDSFGRPRQNPYDSGARPIDVPEVLANRILPSRYDGQIVLSTNTSAYDPTTNGDADTFLASFDGDLDTATCQGNGREQAKWPYSAEPDSTGNYTYTGKGHLTRCVQCIGLLGQLNDKLIASDPGIPLIDQTPFVNWADKAKIRWIYPFLGISSALMPVTLGSDPERPSYWNNVSVRMGSLRTDGAYLSAPGVSGNNATLKYLYSPDKSNRHKKLNFQPDSPTGNCVTMWAKTTWHHDDMRNHEFFNPGNDAKCNQCAAYYFQKMGQYKWCSANASTSIGHCGNRRDLNDLSVMMMYQEGSGYGTSIFGGFAGTPPNLPQPESPGFHVQPFRWSFVGFRANYDTQLPSPQDIGPHGHLATQADSADTSTLFTEQHYVRPFISTEMYPEDPNNYGSSANSPGYKFRWSYRGYANQNLPLGPANAPNTVGQSRDEIGGAPNSITDPNATSYQRDGEGQDAKWVWAEPYGQIAPDPDKVGISLKSFGMNNLNFGNPKYTQQLDPGAGGGATNLQWHYRNFPEDGTYAVIDELKISNKDRVLVDGAPDWNNDRVTREMQISRYYLPPSATDSSVGPENGGPPTFTSQTLLQSLKGSDKLVDTQNVAVVRVSWNVFTPRFMSEYRMPTGSKGNPAANFNNSFVNTEYFTTFGSATQNTLIVPFKGPFDYEKYNDVVLGAASPTWPAPAPGAPEYYGVNRPAPWYYQAGLVQSGRGVEVELLNDPANPPLDSKTFTDPAARNALGTPDIPIYCFASKLRYRVRFKYPVDTLVDTSVQGGQGAAPVIDPDRQYLLDTPVFDDISVTYITAPRILAFREVVE